MPRTGASRAREPTHLAASVLHDVLVMGTASASRSPRRRRVLVLVAVVAAVALGCVTWWVFMRTLGDGDPGGERRAVASQVSSALPPRAQVLQVGDGRSRRDSCDGRPGTEGWSAIVVAYQFTTDDSSESVVTHASRAMAAQHWTQTGRDEGQLGPVLTWTKTVTSGVTARATLAPEGRASGRPVSWDLSAVVPPAGKAASGC